MKNRMWPRFFVSLLIGIGQTHCATGQSQTENAPQVVLGANDVDENEANEVSPLLESPSVTAFMTQAFEEFNASRFKASVRAFNNALATGDLNDAGRIMAYWHLFVAYNKLSNMHRSMESLTSFVVVAEDAVRELMGVSTLLEPTYDFLRQFGLERRLVRARAILSAAWAWKSPGYGKSESNPIIIEDMNERNDFLELYTDCPLDGQSLKEIYHHEASKQSTRLQHVVMTCHKGNTQNHTFYFQFR